MLEMTIVACIACVAFVIGAMSGYCWSETVHKALTPRRR
jgi:hypothetical protein